MRFFRRQLKLKDVRRLRASPGDTIVLSTKDQLSVDEVRRIADVAKAAFGDIPVVILDKDLDLLLVSSDGPMVAPTRVRVETVPRDVYADRREVDALKRRLDILFKRLEH